MARTVRQPGSASGYAVGNHGGDASPAPGNEREGVRVHSGESVKMADIVAAEEELVLGMFAKLKDKRDGELRISTRRNPRTGIVEIIYAGAHEKGDLSKVRRLYEQAGRGTVTF